MHAEAVALLPPITSGCGRIDAEPLATGPRFVRTRAMSRWHRVRSGVRFHDGRLVYQLWCGSHVFGDHHLSADAPGADEPVCALCDGKAVGAGQEPDGPSGRTLIYTPRHLAPPKTCPGSRSDRLYEELPGDRVGRCLACGDVQPLRAMGGPYASRYAIIQHPPGADLVGPCPFHRWRQLTTADGRVRCACGREVDR